MVINSSGISDLPLTNKAKPAAVECRLSFYLSD